MSYLITTTTLENYTHRFKDFFISSNSKFDEVYISEEEFILIEGFVFDTTLNKELSINEVLELVRPLNDCVLPEYITGQFNIVYINPKKIKLINDFVGISPLYYSFKTDIYITNNIYSFFDYEFKFDDISFFQSFVGRLYGPVNNNTLFENVSQLRAGEYIIYNISTKDIDVILDSMNIQNLKVTNQTVDEIIKLLKENATIFNQISKNIVVTLSGGVDSRVVVSSFS